MALVLIECHKASHRHCRKLQSQEEKQEVSGTDHKIHTDQSTHGQDVELSCLMCRISTLEPPGALQEDNQGSEAKNGLQHGCYLRRVVHSSEQGDIFRLDAYQHLQGQQHARYRMKKLSMLVGKEKIGHKHQYESYDQANFLTHMYEL